MIKFSSIEVCATVELGTVKGTIESVESLTEGVQVLAINSGGRRMVMAVTADDDTHGPVPLIDPIDAKTIRALATHVLAGGRWNGSETGLVNTMALGIIAFIDENGLAQ